MKCENCDFEFSYTVDGREYSHEIGVEIQGVYDGALFWMCPRCEHKRHRWPENDFRHARAERYM